ncbi:MAG: peptide chain release factor N(5)-glutamine methyltransferase [Verrucomicrobiae bacterium]|nr:peptide chain release factor N(5)-glutamine methyltransferase [Verrucomicrobiae bacterium]
MKILELIQKTTAFFQKKNVPEPRLNVEWLVAHALRIKRLDLYLQFERELSEGELEPLRELVRRRAEREPLQYILGETEFFGRKYHVDRRALIPRRETEHLIEAALLKLPADFACRGVDLGTGSGVLAITLALERPASKWLLIDASDDALALASENARQHGLGKDRVEFRRSSWWSAVSADERFDLIVSNPPYVRADELERLQPEILRHEPAAALDGGADGLAAYREIIAGAAAHAAESANAILEIGFDQAEAVASIFRQAGWKPAKPIRDLQGHARVIMASR